MIQIDWEQASANFPELLTQVEDGESIIICRNKVPVAQIVPMPQNESKTTAGTSGANEKIMRQFGSAKDKIKISADFDAPLDDFKQYS